MIDTVPVQDAINAPAAEGAPVKRGPGRPRKDGSPAQPRLGFKRKIRGASETPPIRQAPLPKRPASMEIRIGGFLAAVNMVILLIPPISADALDNAEITALARALDQQCSISPRFRRYMEQVLGIGSGAQLFGVVAIIIARRAARHGMLGPDQGPMVDTMLGAMIAGADVPTPQPVRDDSAHDGDGPSIEPQPISQPVANPLNGSAGMPTGFSFEPLGS